MGKEAQRHPREATPHLEGESFCRQLAHFFSERLCQVEGLKGSYNQLTVHDEILI